MFDLLDPLHDMIDRGATTLKEQSFKQVTSLFLDKNQVFVKYGNQ